MISAQIVRAAVLVSAVSFATDTEAATYYVSRSGSNSFSCAQAQSEATPRQTVNAGASCLKAGDTLYVRAGTYSEGLSSVPSGTSWSSKVRIAAYPGESVWLAPSSSSSYVIYFGGMQQYIEFDGINLNASNTVYGTVKIEGWSGGNAHHIRIKNAELIGQKDGKADGLSGPMQILASASVPGIIGGNEFINLTIHGGGDPGDFAYAFYFNSSDNLVEGCNIYDVSGAGVHIYNGYGVAANNNIIRNNIIHDITRSGDDRTWGVVVSNGSGNKVYNNIIYNIQSTQSFGIRVYSPNNEVYNNTVYNVRQFGIEVLSAASGTILKNNVAHGNGANYMNRATGTIASNNSFNGIDPRFVNPSAGDFRVQSTSPLVDAGTIVAAVTADAVGVPRPQLGAYDIGAFEFSGEQASPSAPTNVRISSR